MPDLSNAPSTSDTSGDNSPLTQDQAANEFAKLLSGDTEDTQPKRTSKREQDEPAVDDGDETEGDDSPNDEDADEDDESTDDEESDEDDNDEDDTGDEDVLPDTAKVLDENGKPTTVAELKKDRLRHADYTRKTQAVAEERRLLDAERAESRQERQRTVALLQQLEQTLTEDIGEEPDWQAALNRGIPVDDVNLAYVEYHEAKRKLDGVKAAREEQQRKDREEAEQITRRTVTEEAKKFLDVVPEWSDRKVAEREGKAMVAYAESIGFSLDDIKAAPDHRIRRMLRDAALYRESQKRAPVVRERVEKVKNAAPGSGKSSRPPVSDETRVRQRFAKTGSQEDAAAVFAAAFKSERQNKARGR